MTLGTGSAVVALVVAGGGVARKVGAHGGRRGAGDGDGVHSSVRRTSGRAALTASVDFDNDASETFTIIDITARDRVGFLYLVTKTLYDLNLDIGSAKIVTEGSRVMDSFYVTDLLREKIIDTARLEKIREALMKVVGQ